ncbi:MAG: hypothetical protein CVT60_06485 [Actinobacteria bacterium HGW-Actinobacteria-10]|jgi:hypothetical protein|nr:MAG: hypothetical protein CVT60_06485 [Actinobacteria bacterium HGW-Actinobacteria-10]
MTALIVAGVLAGCTPSAPLRTGSFDGSEAASTAPPLPDSAYYVDPSLGVWIDPDTGYDTTRDWALTDSDWPVGLIMSPSQSPQLVVGEERDGIYTRELAKVGITPRFEKIDIPARTFHALQRSKWAFVYMPYAVFTDYCRTHENQGGAGGLQYVALAGSTAGAGYTLIARDPEIRSVVDLAGKTVAGLENNPARIVLMEAAAKKAGLTLGDGEGDIRVSNGASADDLNGYLAGDFDAVIVLRIVRERFLRTGSHVIEEFTDVGYIPNYTILTVERSVLEERPDAVDAFLKAHHQAHEVVEAMDKQALDTALMDSWNGYFRSQETTAAPQRLVADLSAFQVLIGDMRPEQEVDARLLGDCFAWLDNNKGWGWDGSVDTSRLMALDLYTGVLGEQGKDPN